MIGLIVARSKNNVIGKNGEIPWKIKGEQKQFRELTTGNVVIMGRKSYEEIGHPLPNRRSIKECIVPKLTDRQKMYVYASEADIINVALFGMTAKEWKEANPDRDGNIRDYADILYLIVLSNLEVLNANMIEEGKNQKERLEKLNNIARKQLNMLLEDQNIIGIREYDRTMSETLKQYTEEREIE